MGIDEFMPTLTRDEEGLAAMRDSHLEKYGANHVLDLTIPCYSLEGVPALLNVRVYVLIPPIVLDPYEEDPESSIAVAEAEAELTRLISREAYRTRAEALLDREKFRAVIEPHIERVLERSHMT